MSAQDLSGLRFDDLNGEESEPGEGSLPPVLPRMLTLQKQRGQHVQFALLGVRQDGTVCVQVEGHIKHVGDAIFLHHSVCAANKDTFVLAET